MTGREDKSNRNGGGAAGALARGARRLIDRPIIVIGCNRSGTTLLFRNLSEHPAAWSLYEESQQVFYRHFPIDPEQGDRLTAPPDAAVARAIHERFYAEAHNKERFGDVPGLRWIPRKLLQRPVGRLYKRAPLRLVEKTPANSLRIPFLDALFPDARYLFLVRRPEDVISSLMEGWKNWSRKRGDPGAEWRFTRWHYLVPPGWRDWTGRPLQEICAFQWVTATGTAWEDLERHCRGRYLLLRHEEATADPIGTYAAIRAFCELPPSGSFDRMVAASARRVFTHGGSRPRPDKWRDLHRAEVESVRPMFQDLLTRLYPAAA